MENIQTLGFPAVIIKGKMIGDRVEFESSYDPIGNHTEGQIRALQMKLKRIMSLDHFEFDFPYDTDGNETVLITLKLTSDGRKVYGVVLQHGKFTEELKASISKVKSKDEMYSAPEFHSMVEEDLKSIISDHSEDDLTYGQAVEYLKTLSADNYSNSLIKRIFQVIAGEKIQPQYALYENLMEFLSKMGDNYDAELILDSSYLIANQYQELNIWDKAMELYLQIAQIAKEQELLKLMVSSRLKAAVITRETINDPSALLDILNEIDDGSMEVASQEEREQYYSMLGYCYDKIGESQMAEDLHYMAVMISESETSPSIYIAESHAYLGDVSGKNFQPEIATRQYLTASTIAHSRNDRHLGTLYSHKAALYELQWARLLSSTAIIMNMNSDRQNAEFYAWQSLKRLVNSISHSDRNKRKADLVDELKQIIAMNKVILPETSEYANTTLNELEKQMNFFVDGALPIDQENELLRFINTKISAMLPLPPPMILIIANDGRLILGGEIGADTWDENILTNDDLFSGALSAIMAILSEVITGTEPLRMLDAGQTQIMIEKSNVCIGALLVDRDLNVLRKALRDSVSLMENEFPGLEDWDGYSIDFSSAKPKIETLFEIAMENIAN